MKRRTLKGVSFTHSFSKSLTGKQKFGSNAFMVIFRLRIGGAEHERERDQ